MLKRSNLFKVIALTSAALFAGLLVTACAPSIPPGTVRVTMDEWNMKLSSVSVPAGKVTFEVVNQGKIGHELVVLKTDLAVASLKMRVADPKKVDEEAQAKNMGEVEDIDPGETKSGTFDLAPGKYVFICNVAEHYKAGMAAAFEVK